MGTPHYFFFFYYITGWVGMSTYYDGDFESGGFFFDNFICKIRKRRSGMKKLSRKTPKFSMARDFVRYSGNTGF